MSNILRSTEVIENLKNANGDDYPAYAGAFGFCWAMLSDEVRAEVIKWSEKELSKKEGN